MSQPRDEGFWRERVRGIGLLIALSLSVLAIATVVAFGVLVVLG